MNSEIVNSSLEFYWFCKLLLIAIFLLFGLWVQQQNKIRKKSFWIFASIVILYYSLFEGLRWNRGVDYYHYYLEIIGLVTQKDREPIYQAIIETARFFDLYYWLFFCIVAAAFLIAAISLLKHFPKSFCWSLLIFYSITDYAAENLVRQFIGLTFLLFAFSAFYSNRKTIAIILLLCTAFVHSSGWFVIVISLGLYYLRNFKGLKTPLILLLIYIIFYIFWDISQLSQYTESLKLLNLDGDSHFGHYIEESDRWFTEEGSLNKINNVDSSSSVISQVINFIYDYIIIYFGFKLKKSDNRFYIPFWFTYIAIIINIIGGDVEIYGRVAWWLKIISPLVAGSILVSPQRNKYIKYIIIGIFLLRYVYPFIRTVGSMPYSGCAFVFDKL